MKRKERLFAGRKMAVAAGILWLAAVSGTGLALASEAGTKTSGKAESGAAVDAQGAEELALLDAGITAEQTERLRTKAEREDGEDVYEVSFTVDRVEYDYLIRESDGKILEWEIDGRKINDAVAEESLETQDGNSEIQDETDTRQDGSALIGLEQAKSIALLDAGLKAEEVSFSKLKFEDDNRKTVYEVEFYQDRWEYEYTIDAYTGEILEVERD